MVERCSWDSDGATTGWGCEDNVSSLFNTLSEARNSYPHQLCRYAKTNIDSMSISLIVTPVPRLPAAKRGAERHHTRRAAAFVKSFICTEFGGSARRLAFVAGHLILCGA